MKESRKGKFYVKGDEGIFLGYSCRSKTYKCLNFSTHKIIESAHVRIDEFAKKSGEESNKELKDYRRFFYYEPHTLPNLFERKETSYPKLPKSPMVTKLQKVQTKSQRLKSQLEDTKLVQIEPDEPEPQIGLKLEAKVHIEDSGIHPKPKEPMLEKYVRRHHASN